MGQQGMRDRMLGINVAPFEGTYLNLFILLDDERRIDLDCVGDLFGNTQALRPIATTKRIIRSVRHECGALVVRARARSHPCLVTHVRGSDLSLSDKCNSDTLSTAQHTAHLEAFAEARLDEVLEHGVAEAVEEPHALDDHADDDRTCQHGIGAE